VAVGRGHAPGDRVATGGSVGADGLLDEVLAELRAPLLHLAVRPGHDHAGADRHHGLVHLQHDGVRNLLYGLSVGRRAGHEAVVGGRRRGDQQHQRGRHHQGEDHPPPVDRTPPRTHNHHGADSRWAR
jgi:hypothetical protein